MQPRILVIGATGTIGSHLCRQLNSVKADFVALVRNTDKAGHLNENGIKTVTGDLSDIDSLKKAMAGIDKVFLLSVTSPDIPLLQGNAARIAKEQGVKHIVKISARSAGVNANFNIGRYHGKTEQIIRARGIPFTFLQPHSFMQNLFFDSKTIKEQNAIYSGIGTGRIPMIDARDIAEVAFTALTQDGHEGKSYVLTGSKAISYYDISDELSKALDRKINFIPITLEEEYAQALKNGLPQWLAADIKIINKTYSEGKGSDVSPDVEKITGRKAIRIDQFIKDHLDRFR